MPQDTAKIKDFTEQSPVAQARAKLGLALEQLESIVLARLQEATEAVSAAQAAPAPAQDDSEQWQNACRLLEQQLATLKEENSQLHSELHEARSEMTQLAQRNTTLESAHSDALAALDDAIAQVESLLKD